MKNAMMKRICIVALVFIMICTMIPFATASASSFYQNFPGTNSQLARIQTRGERVTIFCGPGTNYGIMRRVVPNERHNLTAYFIQNNMVFVHYVHTGVDMYGFVVREAVRSDLLYGVPEIWYMDYDTESAVVSLINSSWY